MLQFGIKNSRHAWHVIPAQEIKSKKIYPHFPVCCTTIRSFLKRRNLEAKASKWLSTIFFLIKLQQFFAKYTNNFVTLSSMNPRIVDLNEPTPGHFWPMAEFLLHSLCLTLWYRMLPNNLYYFYIMPQPKFPEISLKYFASSLCSSSGSTVTRPRERLISNFHPVHRRSGSSWSAKPPKYVWRSGRGHDSKNSLWNVSSSQKRGPSRYDQTETNRPNEVAREANEREGRKRRDTWSLLIVIQWQGAPVEIQMTKILLWLPRSRLSSQCDRQGYQEPLSFGRQLVDSHAKKRGGGATFLLG